MLIYKNVIAKYLKDNFGVGVVEIHDDGTLCIDGCGAYDRKRIEEEIISQFPRIKRVCVADSKAENNVYAFKKQLLA